MLKVQLHQAKPDMVLARKLYDPAQPKHTLLKAGYQLNETDIARLNSLEIPSIWVRYPNLEFLDNLVDPELTELQQAVYDTFKTQFNSNNENTSGKVDYQVFTRQMSMIYKRMSEKQSKNSLYLGDMQGETHDQFRHGCSVAHLAMIMGMKMEAYLVKNRPNMNASAAIDLTQLGVGCLLHDIGKLNFDKDMQEFKMTAQSQGNLEWQQHIQIGYDMVKDHIDSAASQVVLNHHQHFDGSGFPFRKKSMGSNVIDTALEGEDIHIFCRIAALADRFEGFKFMPDGSEAPNIVALKRLHNPGYVKWFDPIVFKALEDSVPPFPPGEQVTLNNGQTCVVKQVNMEDPCRPTVVPINMDLTDVSQFNKEENKDIPKNDIHLEIRQDLKIVKAGDFDVEKFLY